MNKALSALLGPLYDDISYFGIIYEGKEYEVTGMRYNLPDPPHELFAIRVPLIKLYASIILELKDKDPSVVGSNSLRELNPLDRYYTTYIVLAAKVLSYISNKNKDILKTKSIVLDMGDN